MQSTHGRLGSISEICRKESLRPVLPRLSSIDAPQRKASKALSFFITYLQRCQNKLFLLSGQVAMQSKVSGQNLRPFGCVSGKYSIKNRIDIRQASNSQHRQQHYSLEGRSPAPICSRRESSRVRASEDDTPSSSKVRQLLKEGAAYAFRNLLKCFQPAGGETLYNSSNNPMTHMPERFSPKQRFYL